MRKIVAIGGGEIGRPGTPVETMSIDKEIIRLSGKKRPKLLFIPTASYDSKGYFDVVQKHFGKRLGCKVDVLFLTKGELNAKQIERKILLSDIIYVGGGNTLRMMNIWRKRGVDKVLRKAYTRGIVLSGVSAGAMCWFRCGNSDSRKFTSGSGALIKVSGLNLVNALFCPHYDFEKRRQRDLKRMMRSTRGVALALENCVAIEILDEKFRIIRSKSKARAYKIFWSKGKYVKKQIQVRKEFVSIEPLLSKR